MPQAFVWRPLRLSKCIVTYARCPACGNGRIRVECPAHMGFWGTTGKPLTQVTTPEQATSALSLAPFFPLCPHVDQQVGSTGRRVGLYRAADSGHGIVGFQPSQAPAPGFYPGHMESPIFALAKDASEFWASVAFAGRVRPPGQGISACEHPVRRLLFLPVGVCPAGS